MPILRGRVGEDPSAYSATAAPGMMARPPGVADRILGALGTGAQALGGGLKTGLLAIPEVREAYDGLQFQQYISAELKKAQAAGDQDRIDTLQAARFQPSVLATGARQADPRVLADYNRAQERIIEEQRDARELKQTLDAERRADERSARDPEKQRQAIRTLIYQKLGTMKEGQVPADVLTPGELQQLSQFNSEDALARLLSSGLEPRGGGALGRKLGGEKTAEPEKSSWVPSEISAITDALFGPGIPSAPEAGDPKARLKAKGYGAR